MLNTPNSVNSVNPAAQTTRCPSPATTSKQMAVVMFQQTTNPSFTSSKKPALLPVAPLNPRIAKMSTAPKTSSKESSKDKSKVHKLSLKGSSKLVAEFVNPSSIYFTPREGLMKQADRELSILVSILDTHNSVRVSHATRTKAKPLTRHRFQRGVYPAEDFTAYVTGADRKGPLD